MAAAILDGTATAQAIRAEIAERVAALKAGRNVTPKLAAVLVGDDPASEAYVSTKGKASRKAGMESETHRLYATATQEEVEDLIRSLNADPLVHGILVQHPIPSHLDETAVLALVKPEKDVDGI